MHCLDNQKQNNVLLTTEVYTVIPNLLKSKFIRGRPMVDITF